MFIMKILTERKSAIFLQNYFDIVPSFYVWKKTDLKKAVERIGFPCVMKVFGDKIIHKRKLKGVILDIKNYNDVLKGFNRLSLIKNAQGVVVQKKIKEKELLVGIKKTPEFGHVVVFGAGGSDVEKKKDVSFRVCPIKKNDAFEMINQVDFSKEISNKQKKIAIKSLMKLCRLIKKHPDITELDINPLIIYKGKAMILDSRLVLR